MISSFSDENILDRYQEKLFYLGVEFYRQMVYSNYDQGRNEMINRLKKIKKDCIFSAEIDIKMSIGLMKFGRIFKIIGCIVNIFKKSRGLDVKKMIPYRSTLGKYTLQEYQNTFL